MIVTAECDYTIKNQFLIIINIGGAVMAIYSQP